MNLRSCKSCNAVKDEAEFYVPIKRSRSGSPSYIDTECKKCKPAKLKGNYKPAYLKYGLTKDSFERMSSCCEICGSGNDLVIYHCHATNAVRGRLCRACNCGMGIFKDSVDLLFRAHEYLRTKKASKLL